MLSYTGTRSQIDRIEREREVETIRGLLDETAFVEAWAEGQAMTLEQGIAYALEESATDLTNVGPSLALQESQKPSFVTLASD